MYLRPNYSSMRNSLLILTLYAVNTFCVAGNSPETDSTKVWTYGTTLALNFSQVSFVNWAAGGESSISATSMLKLNANYIDSTQVWKNNFDISYGVIRQGDIGKVAKSDDRFELNSSYGLSAFKKWYYNMSFNLKSQIAKGYNSPLDSRVISDFLAPAYITLSIGMSRTNKKRSLDFQLLPLSGKITYVNNQALADSGAFGLERAVFEDGLMTSHALRMRTEFGGSIKFQYKDEILENVTLQSKACFFSNYKEKATSIDVDWELLLLMKINKYLTANINSHIIYDEDVDIAIDKDGDGEFESSGPRTQFKELFGLGLSYSF